VRNKSGNFFILPGTKEKKAKYRRPTLDGQEVLEKMTVRLIVPEEEQRFNDLFEKEHYSHGSQWVHGHLRYIVTCRGQWLALASWERGGPASQTSRSIHGMERTTAAPTAGLGGKQLELAGPCPVPFIPIWQAGSCI
jgi:hypothetical protein